MKDKVHRSHKAYGGYHGDMKAHSHAAKPSAENTSEQAMDPVKMAINFLQQRIGSKWNYDSAQHLFSAEFDSRIIDGLQGYIAPQKVKFGVMPFAAQGKTRLTLTLSDYTTVHDCVPFIGEKKSIADQFIEIIRSESRDHGKPRNGGGRG